MDNQISDTNSLPSINDLFKQAWATFKGTWVQLLILYLIIFGVIMGEIIILIILFAVIFVLGGGIISGGFSQDNLLSSFTNPSVLIPLVVISVIGFSVIFVTGLMGQIGTIKIIGSYPNKKTLSEIYHESSILPVIGVSLLSFFLVIGGYMVFIIPGILLSIYFSFALYEVILDGKRGFQALRLSWGLVANHFWQIILRLLILLGLYIAYMVVVIGLVKVAPVFSSLTNFVEIPFSWFVTAYVIALYKELKSKSGAGKEKSIGWMAVVAIVGWVILIGLTIVIVSNAKNFMPYPKTNYGNIPITNYGTMPIDNYQNNSTGSSPTY